jgi:hypothetical protein
MERCQRKSIYSMLSVRIGMQGWIGDLDKTCSIETQISNPEVRILSLTTFACVSAVMYYSTCCLDKTLLLDYTSSGPFLEEMEAPFRKVNRS